MDKLLETCNLIKLNQEKTQNLNRNGISNQKPPKNQVHNQIKSDNFNGTPLQYSCLENPMDGEAWWAAVHGVPRSRTWLSDFIFTFHFHALEKEMATHSSVLAWRIPGMGKPGGLPSMGSHRVGHDWSHLAAAAAGEFFNLTKNVYGKNLQLISHN